MLIVKKFGGTSVADKERIYNVARRCIEDYKKGNDIVVVLSAMGKTTDVLISQAKEINPNPPKREMDMLFTVGEQTSVALMAMAMDALGVPAVSLNAFQVAMHTTSRYGNARLKRIDTERIRNELEARKIVIVTGFQGIDKMDNYTTLGRGGSDVSAFLIGHCLDANEVIIVTDVEGVMSTDPNKIEEAELLDEILIKISPNSSGLLLTEILISQSLFSIEKRPKDSRFEKNSSFKEGYSHFLWNKS